MKTIFSFIIFVVGFLCMVNTIQGQNYHDLQFEHITNEQGLSQSTGNDILQDHQGFMWFGTSDGLNKFDGHEIKVYKEDRSDSLSISGNSINVLFEDSKNNLWIGTSRSGLNLYDRDRDTFIRYKTNLRDSRTNISDDAVNDILEDEEGRLWIGTQVGLNWYYPEEDSFAHIYAASDIEDSTDIHVLSNKHITALEKGQNAQIWVGTQNGLNRWDPETKEFSHFHHDPADPYSLSENAIHDLEMDADGRLWIGTSGGGLNYYNTENENFYHYQHDPDDPKSISGNSVLTLFIDNRGMLWLGTEDNGLSIFDRESQEFIRYTSNNQSTLSIGNNSIHSIFESRDQTLWIGTFSGGIDYVNLKPPKFEHYKYSNLNDNQLSTNSVIPFLEDSYGNFWVGTDGGGLNLLDREGKTFKTIKHEKGNPNSPSSNVILALHEDADRNIWIGYYNGGISKFNPQTGRYVHYRSQEENSNSLNSDHVYVIHEDDDGTMWFGVNEGGINRLDPENGNFRNYLSPNAIRAIHPADNGKLWVGGYGTGLISLDPSTGESYSYIEENADLPGNSVMTIHEDKERALWLGMRKGLVHFDREKSNFTTYEVDDGLANNVVKGILEDKRGNLWLSTNGGISKFNPNDTTFTNFGPDDGLQANEFNQVSSYKDSDGYMYFGGVNGFNRFHPDSIKGDESVPPIQITDFQIFNRQVPVSEKGALKKQISQASKIQLPYDASVITFTFAALDFNKTKANNYAYKLDGFDNDWNYVNDKRTATYTNLDPGEYTFRAKVFNGDGVSNEEEAQLALIVTPPFWKTYAFYAFTGTFGAILFLGFYQWKVLSVRSRNEQLEEKVAERTAELDKKNSDLEEALKELKETRSQLVEKARKAGMADIATGVLHNVGNILNSVNTSAAVIQETAQKSELDNLYQANNLLKKNIDRIEYFILESPKGEKLLSYYLKLEGPLKNEQKKVIEQSRRLNKKIDLIKEVIAAQQSYASASMEADQMSLEEMIDDALSLQSVTIERHELTIKKELNAIDAIRAHRTQLIHILVNLFKNAKEAVADNEPDDKVINIKTWQDKDNVYLAIADNGCGIKEKNLDKIFTQGFTTKKGGHGFGLHSCANYMQSMGGDIRVESDGTGATFTLVFPIISNDSESTNEEGVAS